jgi:hypothetical protein
MSEESSSPAPESSTESPSPSESSESNQGSQGQQLSQNAEVEAIEEAAANGDISQKEAEKLIKKFQLKVNGKLVEKTFDLGDENFLKNQFQLAEAARQSMQQSSELKKLYEKEVGRLKSNPWEVLKELGMDPDELAELRIQSRIEEMKKSPEQIERENIQKELQEAREEAKRLKEEKESAEFERMREQAAAQIEDEITQALDAHSTLPKSRHVVKRIADSMLWAMNNGFDNVSAEDVIPMVEKDLMEEFNRFMDDSPEEMIEKFVGKRNIERMRQKRIASAPKAPTAPLSQVKSVSKPKEEEKPKEKLSQRAFFKQLGRK